MGNCVAPSTCSAYQSAQRRYATFCMKYGVGTPYPLQEDTLCRYMYVAFLAKEGLISRISGGPFVQPMPRLEYVLTGSKRVECRGGSQPRTRLPITIEVLQRLKDVWLAQPWSADGVMLSAAACVVFGGVPSCGGVHGPILRDPSQAE